ncbi:MAG: alanine racemase [Muricoprocola sp.]
MEKYSRVYAKIDLDAVEYNFASMKKNLQENVQMIAVIKADGYGHGAIQIGKLVEGYPYLWGFAVATAEEALELRSAGLQKPILILGYTFEESFEKLISQDIRPVVFQLETARKLSEIAVSMNKTAKIHLAVDTGMSRIGFRDNEESIEIIKEISTLPNLFIEGAFTHFARADEADKTYAQMQFERYHRFMTALEESGVKIPIWHCSNSAALMDMPQANLNLVRAGISIYGIYPSEEVKKELVPLKPVMELKSHISYVKTLKEGIQISYGGTYTTQKETRVATIPVGYADGYPRMLSNKGWVLIQGKKAPILGRVCMDQFMVDVTDIPEAEQLMEVTLLGEDHGNHIMVEELSELCGRFPYEFVCDINKRVPRVYVKGGQIVEQKDFFCV